MRLCMMLFSIFASHLSITNLADINLIKLFPLKFISFCSSLKVLSNYSYWNFFISQKYSFSRILQILVYKSTMLEKIFILNKKIQPKIFFLSSIFIPNVQKKTLILMLVSLKFCVFILYLCLCIIDSSDPSKLRSNYLDYFWDSTNHFSALFDVQVMLSQCRLQALYIHPWLWKESEFNSL